MPDADTDRPRAVIATVMKGGVWYSGRIRVIGGKAQACGPATVAGGHRHRTRAEARRCAELLALQLGYSVQHNEEVDRIHPKAPDGFAEGD